MMAVIIIAIDALEYNLVEEFDCKNLKQEVYGKTDISEFSQPRTMVLWSSFLTGKNKEKEILSLGDKEMWHYRVNVNETFVSKFKNPKVIDLPGFSYDLEQHDKERILLKKFFEEEDKEKIKEEYNKLALEHHKKIKKEFEKALKENHDLIIAYFSVVDVIGHLNFGNKTLMKILYKEMDEIARKARELGKTVLVISDHGMKAIGKFGDHSDYGFWSLNRKIDLGKPKLTEFKDIILKKLKEDN